MVKKDEQIKAAQNELKDMERKAAEANQQLARLRTELWLLGKEKLALRRPQGKRFFNTILTMESEGKNVDHLRKIASWNAKAEISSDEMTKLLRQQARLLRSRKELREEFYSYGK